MSFVHLHVHSEYSMLDGLGSIKGIVARAKELNSGAVALTDHGVMYGAYEFWDNCTKAGIKPLIGMEGYLTKRGRSRLDRDVNFDKQPYHMLMLAMNNTGYKNLMRISSIAQLEGFYFRPRADHALLEECNAGIIATSGCLAGEIPRLITSGQVEQARDALKWYRQVFEGRFYLELQEHDIPELEIVNKQLVEWSNEFSLPLIATNDAHYVLRSDSIPHDLMLCIQTTAALSEKDRMRFNNDSYHMADEAEMRAMFDKYSPAALSNTLEVAEKCSVSLKTKSFYLPNFRRPEKFTNDDEYLRYLCEIGFEQRYGIPAHEDGTWRSLDADGYLRDDFGAVTKQKGDTLLAKHKKVFVNDETPIKLTALSPLALASGDTAPSMTPRRLRERLDFELKTISGMGFPKYMLIVWDLIRFCREQGIWWDVRGSAAGSIVSHTLLLTNIEPVSNDLYFERFLNPERVSMPDIDMDFPDDQRHRLVDYTIDKYGKDNVAQIITFGTMAARASLKDVGRVMEVPLSEVNKVTSLVPAIPGKPINLKEARETVTPLRQLLEEDKTLAQMYERAITVEGRVRNAGTHAAGVVIADKPLIEYVPLNRLTGTPITEQLKAVTQFEMNHLEAIGLLKLDYLGLSMLTIMRRACDLIANRHGMRYTLDNIPIHEKCIFDMLSKGDVLGVFQVEGAGMKKLMSEMRPTRYENILAAISLFRPGPMEYIPTYNRRLHGEEPVTYHHPDLAQALGETYGILVYQEQIMRVARDFAGYSMGEADTIRKAVSKKVKEDLDKHKNKFRDGAVAKGYPAEVAEKIWSDIEYFARYGFNKSHAAIYASITCQTAWLKVKYPLEYMTALMTSEADSAEKIAALIADARVHNIEVLPPSVNWSMADFSVDESKRQAGDGRRNTATQAPIGGIRFGLSAIKNVGTGPIEAILKARYGVDTTLALHAQHAALVNKPFSSLDEFCRRVDMTQFNKRALECLIKVGALDEFGARPQLLAVIDQMVGMATAERKAAEKGQSMLFGLLDATDDSVVIELPKKFKDVPHREMLTWEKELVGTYVSEHPLSSVMQHLGGTVTHTLSQLGEEVQQQSVTVAGVIQSIRPHTTKSGNLMAFGVLEDVTGTCEITIFPKTYQRFESMLQPDKVMLVYGKCEVRDGRGAQILVDRVADTVDIARSADIGPKLNFAHVPEAAPAPVDAPLVFADEETGAYETPPPPDDVPWWEEATVAPPATSLVTRAAPQAAPVVSASTAPVTLREAAVTYIAPPIQPAPTRVVVPPLVYETGALIVSIPRSGDPRADSERLQAVHATLVFYEGDQPFSIKLKNGGKKDQVIDFPNDSTRDCAELRLALKAIGAELG